METEESMNGLSVIIPSKDWANLSMSLIAVLSLERTDVRVIVVDDGVNWASVDIGAPPTFKLPMVHSPRVECAGGERGSFTVIAGLKPFVFARNVNLGIAAAGSDDVVLLNDDAVLETLEGFTHMQRFTAEHPDVGLISASTNLAGNPEQMRRAIGGVRILGKTPGNSFPTVAFVCVLIPRRTIDKLKAEEEDVLRQWKWQMTTGFPLDEIFTAYGWEDNDFCRRVHFAGLKVAVSDTCFVDHARLHSTFRGNAYAAGSIHDGRQIYLKKWGTM